MCPDYMTVCMLFRHMRGCSALLSVVLQVRSADREVMGPAELRQLLLAAGAEARFATDDWVASHAALIAWQMACQERIVPDLQGRLLTSDVVLDALKYRLRILPHALYTVCYCIAKALHAGWLGIVHTMPYCKRQILMHAAAAHVC